MLPCGHLCASLCGERCPSTCLECITGTAPNTSQIFLPCGHHYEVRFLDDHFRLNSIYDMDEAGNIQGLTHNASVGAITDIICPRCEVSCKETKRYAIFHQIRTVKDSVDRAQANFSRRYHKLLGNINQTRGMLNDSVDGFRNGLRPGPLAASQNALMVLQRGNAFAEVEAKIDQLSGMLLPCTSDIFTDVRRRNSGNAI